MEEHIPGFGYSQVVRTCIALTLSWLVGMCREVERGREKGEKEPGRERAAGQTLLFQNR